MDSTGAVDRQWRAWARQKGVDGDEIMAIAHGVRALEVIQRVAPHLNAKAEVEEFERHEAEDNEGIVAMPGAAELLRSIPEGRWCVVTSGGRFLASARMKFCGLPVPHVFVTADDVTHGKPHPEPYLKGAKLLGFAPEECIVIEDAPAGIAAAHAGGIRVIGVASTYPAEKLAAADAVAGRTGQIKVRSNGAGKLAVEIQ
jgi:sugar-phosphatase